MFNLLSNALKFTFHGAIAITLSERDGGVVLEVRDTGVGIPESELPRLFERFHRVSGARARTHEGTGIGLALAQELVKLHGGRIDVQSREEAGTTFIVWLPRGSAHLPQSRLQTTPAGARPSLPFEALPREVPHASAPNPADAPPPSEGRRILVVDDNADMREYLRNVLAVRGAVETASDGDEALAIVRRAPPDLVVTDVSMPRRDGFELIDALRSDERTARVPVIVVSARAGEEARVEGLRAGADDYVAKPFSSAELLARVDLQLEVVRARELAEHERRRLLSVFEQAPVAIFVYRGRDHVIELANPLACEILTRPTEQLLGKPLFEAVPDLRNQGYEEILARVLETGERFQSQALTATLERDGERVTGYFDFIYEPMREVDGTVVGVVCIFVEVTARVLAQRKLAEQRARLVEANAAAESANRAKDEFLALLGHELRNPLAPISAALDVMRMKGDTAVGKEREVIQRQVEHMSALVSDLLDVSRVVSGKITLYLGPVRLSEAVRRGIELTSPLIEANLHRVRVDVDETVWLLADPVRLTQIISNVLTNAARYTDPEGHIEVWTEVGALDVALHIRDDGVGIDPDLLPRVFEMFAQAPRPIDRRQGGLGLGLALVKNLVGLHGGEVSIESKGRGGGTEVVIRMPTIPAPDQATPASGVGTGREEEGFAALRVLVVDDNEDAANLLASALRRSGHTAESVYEPVSALEQAEQLHPDVILLDIGLPVMDGYEVARRIRALGLECTLIAVTGYGQRSDVEAARAAGFDRHMIKPVDLAELREVLAEIGRARSASRVFT